MMKRTFHGIMSLVLVYISFLVGALAIAMSSYFYFIIYLSLIITGSAIIMFFYCIKCECRSKGCSHVLPGKLLSFIPEQKEGSYSIKYYGCVGIPLFSFVAFPQMWLFRTPFLLVLFWILLIMGVLDILKFLCPQCKNCNCPMVHFFSTRNG